MPCFHPNQMVKFVNPDTGEFETKFVGPAYDTASNTLSMNVSRETNVIDVVNVPCRTCIGCRLDYARNWANRMLLELDHHNGKAVFVTLTYNDASIPINHSKLDFDGFAPLSLEGQLCPRDVELWLKRVRKFYRYTKIRYYLCGEYGDHTHRPHYHAILFGLCMDDFDGLYPVMRNELGQLSYSCASMESLWGNGYILIAPAEYRTFAYVSRYVIKKSYGYRQDNDPMLKYYEPEFSRMSRRPGLGAYYLVDHPEYCADNPNVKIASGGSWHDIPIPSQLLDILAKDDPQRVFEYRSTRRQLADDNLTLKLMQHCDSAGNPISFEQYLQQQELNLENRVKRLKSRKGGDYNGTKKI